MSRRAALVVTLAVALAVGLAAEAWARRVVPRDAWSGCFPIGEGARCIHGRPRCRGDFAGLATPRAMSPFALDAEGARRDVRRPGPRVALYGASNVFGLGVRDDEPWPARVGEALGIDLRNFAVPGHDLAQQMEHALATRAASGARVAVFALTRDDLEPMDCRAWARLLAPTPSRLARLLRAWRFRPHADDRAAAEARGFARALAVRRAHRGEPWALLALGSLGEHPALHAARMEALRRAGLRVFEADARVEAVFAHRDPAHWDAGDEQLSPEGHRAVAHALESVFAEVLRP